MGKLGHNDKAAVEKLCGAVVVNVGSFNSQGIANSLNALGKLGHNDKAAVEKLCGAVVANVGSFNSQGIARSEEHTSDLPTPY